MWVYYFVRTLVRIYYKFMFRMEFIGMENVPKEGAAVLCCNHISNYDPLTMAAFLDRLPRFIAKKELFRNKLFAKLLYALKASFKTAVKTLKEGEMLGIFAEGTRVKEGEEKAAKAGVAMFALKGNAPVIPVAISGKYKFRGKITVSFGEPMWLEEYRDIRVTTEKLEEITGKIMTKVNEMKVKE